MFLRVLVVKLSCTQVSLRPAAQPSREEVPVTIVPQEAERPVLPLGGETDCRCPQGMSWNDVECVPTIAFGSNDYQRMCSNNVGGAWCGCNGMTYSSLCDGKIDGVKSFAWGACGAEEPATPPYTVTPTEGTATIPPEQQPTYTRYCWNKYAGTCLEYHNGDACSCEVFTEFDFCVSHPCSNPESPVLPPYEPPVEPPHQAPPIRPCVPTNPDHPVAPPPPQQVCGNGIVEGTEQCDDGNDFAGDGCAHCFVVAAPYPLPPPPTPSPNPPHGPLPLPPTPPPPPESCSVEGFLGFGGPIDSLTGQNRGEYQLSGDNTGANAPASIFLSGSLQLPVTLVAGTRVPGTARGTLELDRPDSNPALAGGARIIVDDPEVFATATMQGNDINQQVIFHFTFSNTTGWLSQFEGLRGKGVFGTWVVPPGSRHPGKSFVLNFVEFTKPDCGQEPSPPPQQVCGNGIMEGTEQCDDGNDFAGDACEHCFVVAAPYPPSATSCDNEFPLCSRPGEPGRCPDGNMGIFATPFQMCGSGEHRGGCYQCPATPPIDPNPPYGPPTGQSHIVCGNRTCDYPEQSSCARMMTGECLECPLDCGAAE